uniref:Uncharacterized protein n=1 Tax=Myotis lucifugus TaxID=59463 RepID=G1Q8B2_MYOLU
KLQMLIVVNYKWDQKKKKQGKVDKDKLQNREGRTELRNQEF